MLRVLVPNLASTVPALQAAAGALPLLNSTLLQAYDRPFKASSTPDAFLPNAALDVHLRPESLAAHQHSYTTWFAPIRGFATVPLQDAKAPSQPGTTGVGRGSSLAEAGIAPHAGMTGTSAADVHKESFMEHPAYADLKYLESIQPIHKPPQDAADRAGLLAVTIMRRGFDLSTGYGPEMTPAKWLRRIIFLETVAGVPGMVAGMLRHLQSLRRFKRDAGWIHTLLEEAENERMHLLTFLELRKPGPLFRAMVIMAQGVFFNAYFVGYLLWPKACHSFVGYLEEEAVRTYTHLLKDIDEGKVWKDTPAPPIAIQYWGLKPDANMRDLVLAVRADEACHSHVNHTLKSLKPTDANPFALGKSHLP